MSITNILCLGYLLRGSRAFPEGIFDLIREPILQACGIQMGEPPEAAHDAWPGFDIARFRQLAGAKDEDTLETIWQQTFYHMPVEALDYLRQHIPTDSLILCFEIAPWLESALKQWSVRFIDIRVSPLRFGRDLYIAMRSNDSTLDNRIAQYRIADEELRLEATYLAANVRMHQQRLKESGRVQPGLDGCMIYIGQAPFDASLIREDGTIVTFADYAGEVKTLAQGRRLLYKPHPFALEHAAKEQQLLSDLTGQAVSTCQLNAYQIVSSKAKVELVGISSGLLQEATWFNKNVHVLFRPFTPISTDTNPGIGFTQVHFHRWLSPSFWHQILAPQAPTPRIQEVTSLAHHHARQTIDQWWDYLKVLSWEKAYAYESFERGGGGALRQRITALETEMAELLTKIQRIK